MGRGVSQGGVTPEMDRSTDENPGPEHHAIVASKPEPIKQLRGASSEENVSYPQTQRVCSVLEGLQAGFASNGASSKS